MPQSVQQLIEQQIERLSPEEQRIVEVGSVAGMEFSAAAVAAGAGKDVDEIEERCEELVQQKQLLRSAGTGEWPDGTVASRYSFIHALYQEILYERVTAGRRVRLHQQIGEREEAAYGDQASEIAAELAVHFEQGRDYRRAIQYLGQAAQKALQRSAYREAIGYLTKGLGLLATLPDTPERAQQELVMRITLGSALIATKGYAAPEVEKTYLRARELCHQRDNPAQLFRVQNGLFLVSFNRGKFYTAHDRAEELLHTAQRVQKPGFFIGAHTGLEATLFWLGEFLSARAHMDRVLALYDPSQYHPQAFSTTADIRVDCLSYGSWSLWFLGYPNQALEKSREAFALAHELAHPFSMAYAMTFCGMLHAYRREWQEAQAWAEKVVALATEQGFPFWIAGGTALRSRALINQGQKEGLVPLRRGYDALRTTGLGLDAKLDLLSWPRLMGR